MYPSGIQASFHSDMSFKPFSRCLNFWVSWCCFLVLCWLQLCPCSSISMKIFYGSWSWSFCSLFCPLFEGLIYFPVHTSVEYVDGCFSFCFCIIFKAETSSIFSRNRKYISRRQAFASFPTYFFKSEENVDLHKFQHYSVKCWRKCWPSQFPTLWCQVLVWW